MPKTKVTIGMTTTGDIKTQTTRCLTGTVAWDAAFGSKYLAHAEGIRFNVGADVAGQRNEIVAAFLDEDADWLLFLDSDEIWQPNLVEALVASADPVTRPVVSGLVMAKRDNISPACSVFTDGETFKIVRPTSIPNSKWWNVATVGAGCLLIHRSVLQAMEDKFGEKYPSAIWFDHQPYPLVGDDGETVITRMGEDYVFSARAAACGFPLIVDTTIELGHLKDVAITREMFHSQAAQVGVRPTFVVIPVKDKLELTKALVEQLREQGGWDGLFIYDNGSGAQTKEWLKAQYDLESFDAKGAGIHQMWNAGINEAMRRSGGMCDVVFLNNDLILGHDFCSGMVEALHSGPWMAVSGNYDGRDGAGEVQQVTGICAEKYDGTGGLAGFAYAVKSELFSAGYRFPEDCKWWFGDNDLVLTMDMMNLKYGVATGVAVEHLGAGTAGNWQDKKWSAQLAQDQAAFARKWSQYGVRVA